MLSALATSFFATISMLDAVGADAAGAGAAGAG